MTRPPAPCAAGRRAAEEGVEDVREAAEARRAEALGPARGAGAADARPAEHVVGLAPLGVAEDLVGLVDLLEAVLRGGIRVDVRVPLLGELAEGALDLGVVGASARRRAPRRSRALLPWVGRVYRLRGSSPASAFARSRTSPSIGGVRTPGEGVLLAGVVGAQERVRADLRLRAVAEPRPGARCRRPGPSAASARSDASQPMAPSETMTRSSVSSWSSRTRYGRQVACSAGVGLLAGGAHRTAATTRTPWSVEPVAGAAAVGLAREAGRVQGVARGSPRRRRP